MRKILLILGMFFIFAPASAPTFAAERIGVISDALLMKTTPYNAYFKTPDFLVQDVIDNLSKSRSIQVVPLSQLQNALLKSGMTDRELSKLQGIQHGYDIDFAFLKKVAGLIGVNKLVIVTSGIDMQRDFLKPTLWNSLNVPGFDTVNPTQRISVYAILVDCNRERVLWEEIYAKNIRNNKMKNLDTTVSQNYEGMMRIKQYSKFVSPEISNAVLATVAPNSVVNRVYSNGFEELVMVTNKKMRVGSTKNLSNTNYIANTFDSFEEKKANWKQSREEARAARAEQKMLKAQQKEAEKALQNEFKPVNFKSRF